MTICLLAALPGTSQAAPGAPDPGVTASAGRAVPTDHADASHGMTPARTSAASAGSIHASPTLTSADLPNFGYIDLRYGQTRQLKSSSVDGTTGRVLISSSYSVTSYDVSEDGSTTVAGLRSPVPPASVWDTAWGLVLTHAGDQSASRLLATDWDTNPVLSADGRTAWWLSYGSLFRAQFADWTQPPTIERVSTAFSATLSRGEPGWLAVSRDGTEAAVLYYGKDGQTEIQIEPLDGGTWTRRLVYTGKWVAESASFVFVDASHFLFTLWNRLDDASPLVDVMIAQDTPAATTLYNDIYDVRPCDGRWYMWKDDSTTSYVGVTDDPAVLPTEWVPRTNGRGTVRYVPSVALPPAIAFASDRATANAVLELGSSRALYRGKLTYIASNLYIRSLVGETAEQNGNITYRGVLQSSIDGVTYANVATTTGARAFRTATGVWTGYTPVLARNTWFRWRYLGDAMTAPGYSTVSKVTVLPIVTAKVARSGSKTTVYGAATRQRGTAILQRLVSGKYVQVATTVMTKAGAFTFGSRVLPHGTYRVVIVADRYWGAAAKVITL